VADRICKGCREYVPQGDPLFDLEYSQAEEGGEVRYHVLLCSDCYSEAMEDVQ
jgi:hypothetical protein